MSLVGASVRRPIFTAMVTMVIVTLGLIALTRL